MNDALSLKGTPPLILVAEDNDVSRQLIVSILASEGYQTIEAIDGSSAWECLQNNKIDIAVIDQNMQPEGGFDFARRIIHERIRLPLVMVTADQSTDLLLEASKLGIKRVMQKPIDPPRLAAIVNRICENIGRGINETTLPEKKSTDGPQTEKDLIERVKALAMQMDTRDKTGAAAAILISEQDEIIAEAQSASFSMNDPLALAELTVISRACRKLRRPVLRNTVMICAHRPSRVGILAAQETGVTAIVHGGDNLPEDSQIKNLQIRTFSS